MRYFVRVNGREREVRLEPCGEGLLARVGDAAHRVEMADVDGLGQFAARVGGRSFAVSVEEEGEGKLRIAIDGEGFAVTVEDERERASHSADRAEAGGGPQVVRSVIPGIVVALLAREGEDVEAGAPLLLLEAMKMQNEIRAGAGGRLERFHVRPGETVAAGASLATLEPARIVPGG